MTRPLQGLGDRTVTLEQRQRLGKIAFALLDLLERAPPEGALRFAASAVGEDDRQRDLAVAEIVAGVLAHRGALGAVIERIVDQLEGDAEMEAEALHRLL